VKKRRKENMEKEIKTKSYEYKMEDRILSFIGYDMTGLSDLTSYGTVTGETLWPSSLLLADYLQNEWWPNTSSSEHKQEIKEEEASTSTITDQTNVLELGCGLGLCGTIASIRLGVANQGIVVMTDGNPKVIARASQLLQRNKNTEKDAPTIHQVLEWGNRKQIEKIRDSCRCQPVKGFDLIIASDILYKVADEVTPETTAGLFVQTVDELLTPITSQQQRSVGQGITQSTEAPEKPLFPPTPRCIVAVERRNVDQSVLFDAFTKRGFVKSMPDGDYYEDIFGERNDEQTIFSNKFLVIFERGKIAPPVLQEKLELNQCSLP